MKSEIVQIYFHRDFDGSAMAGIFAHFVAWLFGPSANIQFHSIDYNRIDEFCNTCFESKVAVLDFPFHPMAHWWFDHHQTSFSYCSGSKDDLVHDRMRWDPVALSCPSLFLDYCHDYYPDFSDLMIAKYSELIKYSDLIDSALYASPLEVYNFDDDYIAFNSILNRDENTPLLFDFIENVSNGDVSKFFVNADFVEKKKAIAQEFQSNYKQVEDVIECRNSVIFIDYSKVDGRMERYVGYLYYPQASYTTIFTIRGDSFYVGIGRNPWKVGDGLNLGDLMSKYGGGGRKNVAAALFESHQDAFSALQEVRLCLEKQ